MRNAARCYGDIGGGGHGRVEDERDVLVPVPVGRPQHHDAVADSSAVQVMQRHGIRARESERIGTRRGLIGNIMYGIRVSEDYR